MSHINLVKEAFQGVSALMSECMLEMMLEEMTSMTESEI